MPDDGTGQRGRDFRTAVADVKAIARGLAMEAEDVLGRRTARVLGVLVLFAVVVGVLLALLDWYIAPSGAEQKQALVVTLAQILGGAPLGALLHLAYPPGQPRGADHGALHQSHRSARGNRQREEQTVRDPDRQHLRS